MILAGKQRMFLEGLSILIAEREIELIKLHHYRPYIEQDSNKSVDTFGANEGSI